MMIISTGRSLFGFEMEHIIAEKHDGMTKADNLALSCPCCNRFYSNIAISRISDRLFLATTSDRPNPVIKLVMKAG